jgi:hypothetical protein
MKPSEMQPAATLKLAPIMLKLDLCASSTSKLASALPLFPIHLTNSRHGDLTGLAIPRLTEERVYSWIKLSHYSR